MRKPIHVLDYTWLSCYIFMHPTEGLWSDSLFPTLYKWRVSFGCLRKISLVVSFYLWFCLDVLCQVNVYKVWGVGFFFVSLRTNPFLFHFHSLSFYSITMVGSIHDWLVSFFQCRRRILDYAKIVATFSGIYDYVGTWDLFLWLIPPSFIGILEIPNVS